MTSWIEATPQGIKLRLESEEVAFQAGASLRVGLSSHIRQSGSALDEDNLIELRFGGNLRQRGVDAALALEALRHPAGPPLLDSIDQASLLEAINGDDPQASWTSERSGASFSLGAEGHPTLLLPVRPQHPHDRHAIRLDALTFVPDLFQLPPFDLLPSPPAP